MAGEKVAPDEAVSDSPRVKSYRQLIVWRKAMKIIPNVYRVSRSWPREEQFGLTIRARRAAVSVSANIAEGRGRMGTKEFAHHLSIAHGSLRELEVLLEVARDLDFLPDDELTTLHAMTDEIGRMLRALLKRFH